MNSQVQGFPPDRMQAPDCLDLEAYCAHMDVAGYVQPHFWLGLLLSRSTPEAIQSTGGIFASWYASRGVLRDAYGTTQGLSIIVALFVFFSRACSDFDASAVLRSFLPPETGAEFLCIPVMYLTKARDSFEDEPQELQSALIQLEVSGMKSGLKSGYTVQLEFEGEFFLKGNASEQMVHTSNFSDRTK